MRLVGPLLVVWLLAGACATNAASAKTLPAMTLQLADGGELNLSKSTDVPRVLNLWATWCAPCREELPAFDQVHQAAAGSVEVIGINVGDSPDMARTLIEELELTFPQALDEDSALNSELSIIGMPSTVFVSADGGILEVHAGALTAPQLTEKIAALQGVQIPLG